MGTHTNSRTAAERGVAQFAEGIPQIIGAAAGPGGPTPPGSDHVVLEQGQVQLYFGYYFLQF